MLARRGQGRGLGHWGVHCARRGRRAAIAGFGSRGSRARGSNAQGRFARDDLDARFGSRACRDGGPTRGWIGGVGCAAGWGRGVSFSVTGGAREGERPRRLCLRPGRAAHEREALADSVQSAHVPRAAPAAGRPPAIEIACRREEGRREEDEGHDQAGHAAEAFAEADREARDRGEAVHVVPGAWPDAQVSQRRGITYLHAYADRAVGFEAVRGGLEAASAARGAASGAAAVARGGGRGVQRLGHRAGGRLGARRGTRSGVSPGALSCAPSIKGGRTTDTNLDATCRTCNRSKGSKDLGSEWIPPKER